MAPDFFFWPEGRKREGLTSLFGDTIGDLNAFLVFTDEDGTPMRFHSHQLRDTYAVELLLAGVLLEDVSKLLTHSSIQTTERHYAPWVKSRLRQLEDKSVEAMRRMGVKVSGIFLPSALGVLKDISGSYGTGLFCFAFIIAASVVMLL